MFVPEFCASEVEGHFCIKFKHIAMICNDDFPCVYLTKVVCFHVNKMFKLYRILQFGNKHRKNGNVNLIMQLNQDSLYYVHMTKWYV